jgi:hypothetical protein
MAKAKTVQLLHMYGSDVNGGQWEWSAELERDATGQVYLALVPTVDEGVKIEAPAPQAIDSGSVLFDRLVSSWLEYVYEDISEAEWREVLGNVAKFDKALGGGLMDRLREEYEEQPVKPPTAADLCAGRATWERAFKGRAVDYVSQEDIRRVRAVHSFVRQYQVQTGELPHGRHLIEADGALSFEAVFPATVESPHAGVTSK